MMKFLIVIDMQNDFIDGSLGTPEAEAIVEAVKAKISVDARCCAGVTPEKHAAALETMRSCQICVEG